MPKTPAALFAALATALVVVLAAALFAIAIGPGPAGSTASPAAAQIDVLFSPSVAITAPQLDAEGDGRNDFFGTRFAAGFTSSVPGCTASASETYFVASTGSVNLSGAEARLLVHPNTESGPDTTAPECVYAISWTIAETQNHFNLSLQPGATQTVSSSSRSASAAYAASPATRFWPQVSARVTNADSAGGGIGDLAGTTLTVSFRSISGSFAGCTSSAALMLEIQASGAATPSGATQPGATTSTSLIGFPEGVKFGCVYDVLWPTIDGLELQVGATRRVSSFEPDASASYLVTTTEVGEFSPAVSIVVPQVDVDGNGRHDFSGTRFEVVFRRMLSSGEDCTLSASQIHVLQDNGRVTLPGSAVNLLDRSGGSSSECIYSVSWPTVANLVRQSGATSMVRISAKTATATYAAEAASRFKPSVRIEVPPTDANGDGRNDFSGTRFRVEFSRQGSGGAGSGSGAGGGSGAGSSSGTGGGSGANASCTASASATYLVADNGTVSVAGSVPDLVDRGVGGTAGCVYDVTWPVVGATETTTLELRPGASQQVSAAARQITARYAPRTGSSFRPSVSITLVEGSGVSGGGSAADSAAGNLAAGYSGTRLVVDFVPASGFEASCTALARVTLVVRDSGQPTVSGVVPPLADRPAGFSSNCRYTVRWPEATGLELQAGATATVQASAPSASATYEIVAAAPSAGPGTGAGPAPDTGPAPAPGTGAGPAPAPGGAGNLFQTNVINLPRGWSVLPFGGPSGMAPADFAQAMEDALNSVWVWDPAEQQWQGWTASRGSVGLSALEPGDVVMVHAPAGGLVVYDPPGLLGFAAGASGWTLTPEGISLVVYGGNRATASQVFARFAGSAVVVYMWNARQQRWEYHLPGRQRLSGVAIPWFSDINPGDAMFVYNISPVEVSIPWR